MKVLISCDYSAAGEHVLQQAQKFLNSMPDIEIHVFSVIDIAVVTASGLYDNSAIVESLQQQAEQVNVKAKQIFVGKDVHFSTEVGYPAERVVARAHELQADLLVLGTHGKTGLNRILIGSVAESVLRHTSCNTLIIPVKHIKNG